jgi:hypothetical protein
MTKEEHKERHKQLNSALRELIDDYLKKHEISDGSLFRFVVWSEQQALDPQGEHPTKEHPTTKQP